MAAPTPKSGRAPAFRDINVTPFVDVMLVLLVVFMVTAPLLTTGLRVELPSVATEGAPLSDTPLVITVTADEQILFDQTDATADIERVLQTDVRVQTAKEVYIRADKDARYGVVARVVAAARAAGVSGLNLLVQPDLIQTELGSSPGDAAGDASATVGIDGDKVRRDHASKPKPTGKNKKPTAESERKP